MMKITRIFIIALMAASLFSACAAVREKKPPEVIKKTIPVEEQKRLARKKFEEILDVSDSSKDKSVTYPKMEKLYLELAEKYPDAPLAQESYFKLIELYVRKHIPPQYDKAEEVYYRFTKAYPRSPVKDLVDRTLGIMYYKDKKWESLLKMTTPIFLNFVEKGERSQPFMLFSYAESNFQLRNFDEAERGFKILLEEFPDFSEKRLSKARITYIKSKR
jgi:tetratricopeptide (TPR) repeat protein